MKKELLDAKEMPKVNPSDLCTAASPHGENTLFVSLLDSLNEIVLNTAESRNTNRHGIAIFGLDDCLRDQVSCEFAML